MTHVDNLPWIPKLITIPPFPRASHSCELRFQVGQVLRAFWWGWMTFEASQAGVMLALGSVEWWEETVRQLLHADSISVMMTFLCLWPGVRGTDNRWCSWSNPQCSRLHGRTLQRSSPDCWLSCWSYWWTPRRGLHTGDRCVWAQHPSQLQRDWEFEQKHH